MRRIAIAVALVLIAAAGSSKADESDYRTYQLNWQTAQRSYLLHAPPNPGGRTLPLVIALHGAGDNAGHFAAETGFAAPADMQGMMIAVPDGTPNAQGGRTFNAHFCCGEAVTRQIDDVGFIGAVIDDIAGHYPLDRNRVYVTGMSNGGMFAYVLAAVHPEWFAGIAPVAAAIGGMTRAGQTYLIPLPDRPVSVMIIHGMKDRLVLYDGGSSPVLSFPNHWKLSVADALSFWATVDRCPTTPDMRDVAGETLRSMIYAGCAANSSVRLWAIKDGDHAWPGDIFPAKNSLRSGAAEILAFFAGVSGRQASASR
jgi:polyhydroxybutyrate depolymerase